MSNIILMSAYLGLISGILLFLSGPPYKWWSLALVALIPWHCALQTGAGLSAGAGLAVGFVLPTLYVLKFTPLMAAGLGTWQSLNWVLLSWLAAKVVANPASGSPVIAGCLAAVIFWLDYTLVPIFGTAQCFARVLVRGPRLIQFARVTGMPGIAFAVVTSQGLLVRAVTQHDAAAAGLLLWLLLSLAAFNEYFWRLKPAGTLKVAAMGWATSFDNSGLMQRHYPKFLAQAAGEGAQLVVSPEAQFAVEDSALWGRTMSMLAIKHRTSLAAGFFDLKRNENRILFLNESGEYQGEYSKTHLVPFFESYVRGKGKRVKVPLQDWYLGGVICQDDNFTDLTRAYGRDGIHLLAVPTHDWSAVKEFHFENSRLRAIETGAGIVRAASFGISAIISPRGGVLRRLDHFRGGDGIIVAEVPLRSGVTLYSLLGDWWVAVCALAAVVAMLWPA